MSDATGSGDRPFGNAKAIELSDGVEMSLSWCPVFAASFFGLGCHGVLSMGLAFSVGDEAGQWGLALQE